jgi:hypothetical protein
MRINYLVRQTLEQGFGASVSYLVTGTRTLVHSSKESKLSG